MLWHKVKGAAQWIGCITVRGRRVSRTVALGQLRVCAACPDAQCHDVLGCYVLTCGEPGVEGEGTCGCVLGWVGPTRRKATVDPDKSTILNAMLPAGKTRCRTACPQGKWTGNTILTSEVNDADR